jgi:DNA-binding transcriptional LysR family regulator
MELRHLRYFLAVAEERHFGRAAQRLHIVQPALSMQIRSLEEELGAALFTRTSRRVELTEAGAVLRIEAERTIAQAERARSVVQRSARGEIGSVRIGFAGNAVFAGKLSSDLHGFHGAYPDVQLELCEIAPLLQVDAIVAGQLDVGYCPALGLAADPQLKADQVGEWPWIVAIAKDHPLARRKVLPSKLLVSEPFIAYAADDADAGLATVLRELLGCEPNIVHRAANTLTVLALAAAGLGIALIPAPLETLTVPNIVYRRLTGSRLTSTLLLLSRVQETSGAVQAYLNLARPAR